MGHINHLSDSEMPTICRTGWAGQIGQTDSNSSNQIHQKLTYELAIAQEMVVAIICINSQINTMRVTR
jgi:hypothetical protein